MSKVNYTYQEFLDACKDTDNEGRNNVATITNVKDDTCSCLVGQIESDIKITDLINGACTEKGIVSNPEILKNWDGFTDKSMML